MDKYATVIDLKTFRDTGQIRAALRPVPIPPSELIDSTSYIAQRDELSKITSTLMVEHVPAIFDLLAKVSLMAKGLDRLAECEKSLSPEQDPDPDNPNTNNVRIGLSVVEP